MTGTQEAKVTGTGKVKKRILICLAVLILAFAGCKNSKPSTDVLRSEVNSEAVNVEGEEPASKEESETGISEDQTSTGDQDINADADPNEEPASVAEPALTGEFVFDLKDVPAFDGTPYVVINENIPLFKDEEKKTESYAKYSELDRLGRCGVAEAIISMETIPTEERGVIGDIQPSGWQTVKYNDLIDGNYLYNRCHLIAYQLAGDNASPENLITGTRFFNVEGMLPFENALYDYVQASKNHVLYRVTPIFEGDNLVASGVTMEAFSVEDEGDGICFFVYVYNAQPGIIIDYATGESKEDPNFILAAGELSSEVPSEETTEQQPIDIVPEDPDKNEQTYVLNTNTKKFHRPNCKSVSDMKEKNKKTVTKSREEIIADGYEPCKRCNP